MTTEAAFPDDAPTEFIPLRSKEGRVQDAEMIRQDFIKSKGSLAPPKNIQIPSTKLNQDEH